MTVYDIDMKTTGTQTRGFEFRAKPADTGKREIEGIGVPYDTETELMPYVREKFAPGSVDATGALLFYGHEKPIGRITAAQDTPEGVLIRAAISETSLGNDVYQLLRDGVLTKMSIGFMPGVSEDACIVEERGDTEVITWKKVKALEFSVVPFPAYTDAKITNVRQTPTNQQKGKTMSKETLEMLTRSDLDPINESLDRMQRQIQALPQTPPAPAMPKWRSMGEWLQDIAAGDDAAIDYYARAFAGNTTGDTIMKDTFVGDFVKLAIDRRRVTPLFSTGALPEKGTSVDFYQVETEDFKAGKQATEGADLPGASKLKLKDANSPVATVGGWTEVSRQAVERATVPALNTLLEGMALKYAQVTDELVKTVLTTTVANAKTKIALGADPAAGSVKQWTDALIDAADLYGATMFNITGLGVSKDVFKALANLETTGNRLMNTGDGRNLAGTIDVPGLSGELLRIPVYLIPGAAANTAFLFDKEAIKTLESPGSPAMLQDSNIINLSQSYSLYGYHAVIVPFPAAIVPIVKAAS